MSRPTKLNELPILEISADRIVSNSGDLTIGFELSKPELFSLSGSDLAAIHAAWVKAIHLLPFGTVLHMQDWYMKAEFEAIFDRGEQASFLAHSSGKGKLWRVA